MNFNITATFNLFRPSNPQNSYNNTACIKCKKIIIDSTWFGQ